MTFLTPKIEELLHRNLLMDMPAGDDHTLHTRSKGRGGLLRLPLENDASIIVKIWQPRNLKERTKALAWLSNGRREWRMHRLLYRAGVPTPEPLWFHRFSLQGVKYEAMAIEDLGETVSVLSYLKKLIAAGRETDISFLEERLVAITTQLVQMRVLDIDHQLNNFVVDSHGRFFRIDFECAKQYWLSLVPRSDYVEMISRLLTSHIYAVQPDARRTEIFAEQLYACLLTKPAYKKMIKESVEFKMMKQRRHRGVDTKVSLPT